MTDGVTWRPPSEYEEDLKQRYGLECPPRWGTPRNPARKTLGGKAAVLMEKALGNKPMPWQRYILDVALEIDPDTGLLFYRKVGLSVPRQQGKTELVFTLMVFRAMAFRNQNIVYAAQTRSDARKRWEDELLARLDTSSAMRGQYYPRKTNGNEALIFKRTRSRIGIIANTESAGHGPPLDLGMIDEAFKHKDDRLEQAMSPAMSTRHDAQMYWVSAGGDTSSNFLNKKRSQGRQMIERQWAQGDWEERVAHFEWYAPESMPRDSEDTWSAVMPALGKTVSTDHIRAELLSMDPAEFDRAYLNRTRKPTPPDDPNVPKREWVDCIDKDSRAGERIAFGIDIAPLRDWASISVASVRPDGRVHVELVTRRHGTDWIVPTIVKLKDLWNPVAIGIDKGGPAGSLLDELKAAGITAPVKADSPANGDLAIPKVFEVAQMCGQMADAIRQGKVAHIDQPLLTGAVNGAITRPLSDAWAWNRKSALADISPLVAATLARWALVVRESAIEPDYDILSSVLL